ncbi:hypothetical protein ENBRE01_2862 [Enteropsectra breve]|nr:hypothetical protein ENBRE01_2862 [Enteropsectra breve]
MSKRSSSFSPSPSYPDGQDNIGGSPNSDHKDTLTALLILKQQVWNSFSGREGEDIYTFTNQFKDFRAYGIPESALTSTALNNLKGAASGIIKLACKPTTLEELEDLILEYLPPVTKPYTLKGLFSKLSKGPENTSPLLFAIKTIE